MKSPNALLEELFRDDLPNEFRDRLLVSTLRAARFRRRRRWVVLGASPLLVFALVWTFFRVEPHNAVAPPTLVATQSPLLVVSSAPLPESMITRTTHEVVELVPTASATLAIITTAEAVRGCQVLDDDQLLALLTGRAAAIVRNVADASRAQLLFLDAEEARAFGMP